jgi:hypothetical protein
MTREEAKALLQVWRPGGQDTGDPRLAEALKEVERDPELAEWFAGQKAFDAAMSAHVQAIPVPRDLKSLILARSPQGHVPFWRVDLVPLFQRPAVRWAMAAVFVALMVVGGWVATLGRTQFADYRREVVEGAWGANPHIDLRASDLKKIQQWAAQHGAKGQITIPSALQQDVKILGCSISKWRGHEVVRICLLEGARHQHLFVTDQIEFPDAPWEHLPDYENCGRWNTTAWSQGGRTYVLVGMKYSNFTKRFYRDGQWRMSI